ncbi:MAG: putative mitochondrial protein, conserved [Geoglossum umbratile]|nr:MAG: putative mitochondrial protein, conserved [Geoglossum umbratile]
MRPSLFCPTVTRITHRLLLARTKPTTTPHRALATKTPFSPSPAPPRLPPDEQAIFERLQQASTSTFSTATVTEPTESVLEAAGQGEELHPDVQRGAKPEFEGEVNPKTGEVGGPKNEPLRWGHGGDWSYNGRVTDF